MRVFGASCEYLKVQAREASSVGSCIHRSDLYKSCFTSIGFHPRLLDVALLCRPMRIRKDPEVSQQCASSTAPFNPNMENLNSRLIGNPREITWRSLMLHVLICAARSIPALKDFCSD